jgi:hypothetical protein
MTRRKGGGETDEQCSTWNKIRMNESLEMRRKNAKALSVRGRQIMREQTKGNGTMNA